MTMSVIVARRAAGTLLLALLGSPGCGAGPSSEAAPDVPMARYVNAVHDYQVDYPERFDLREYSAEAVSIGRAAGDGFAAQVELSLEVGDRGDFADFVRERARLACAADAPGISLRCPDVEARGAVRSKGGYRGEVLYLAHERTEGGGGPPVEVSERGPFVAFDFSDRVRGDEHAVLFVRAPVTLQPWETDAELVLAVARSLDETEDADE